MSNEKELKELLKEARFWVDRAVPAGEDQTIDVCLLLNRIDEALAEPLPVPVEWHRVYNSRSKYYTMKRELICFVEHSNLLGEAYWYITLANGKQDHIFRHGVANTVEEAKESATIALAAM